MIKEVTSDQVFENIISDNEDVLMEFFASWCPHCKAFYPVLNAASARLNEEGITVAQTEIDTYASIADEYDIQSIPTLIFFHDGQPVAETSGELPEEGIFEFVKQAKAEI